MRISNIIGFKKYNPRKIHHTYLDYLINRTKKRELILNQNVFKDFLDINTFSKIINLIIKNKVFGTYNISIGKKIYLTELNNWLLSSIKNDDEEAIESSSSSDTESFVLEKIKD